MSKTGSFNVSAWTFTKVSATRSRNMAAIRSRDTSPEIAVRSVLHRMGYRFRLHCKEFSGCPDIVLPRHRIVIFVHGCFWHWHRCKVGRRAPKTNKSYWEAKRSRNRKIHSKARRDLRRHGWSVLVVWECQTKDPDRLRSRLTEFISQRK
jgi:DNA mismatch endonuclease (patch repair protein)